MITRRSFIIAALLLWIIDIIGNVVGSLPIFTRLYLLPPADIWVKPFLTTNSLIITCFAIFIWNFFITGLFSYFNSSSLAEDFGKAKKALVFGAILWTIFVFSWIGGTAVITKVNVYVQLSWFSLAVFMCLGKAFILSFYINRKEVPSDTNTFKPLMPRGTIFFTLLLVLIVDVVGNIIDQVGFSWIYKLPPTVIWNLPISVQNLIIGIIAVIIMDLATIWLFLFFNGSSYAKNYGNAKKALLFGGLLWGTGISDWIGDAMLLLKISLWVNIYWISFGLLVFMAKSFIIFYFINRHKKAA